MGENIYVFEVFDALGRLHEVEAERMLSKDGDPWHVTFVTGDDLVATYTAPVSAGRKGLKSEVDADERT